VLRRLSSRTRSDLLRQNPWTSPDDGTRLVSRARHDAPAEHFSQEEILEFIGIIL
jgi:hypothetical protein